MMALSKNDIDALMGLFESTDQPTEFVHIRSSFRFRRLQEFGLVATIPPRLTGAGLAWIEKLMKEPS